MSVGEFWDLSLADIGNYIEAYEKREEYKLRRDLQIAYELGDVIGNRISVIFSKENTVELMTLEKTHPSFFTQKDNEEAERERMLLEAERQAQTRREFAQKWNPILRKKYNVSETPSNNRGEHQGVQEGDGASQSGSQQAEE